jgi:hypothetical protein
MSEHMSLREDSGHHDDIEALPGPFLYSDGLPSIFNPLHNLSRQTVYEVKGHSEPNCSSREKEPEYLK